MKFKIQILGWCADLLGWFLLGACLAGVHAPSPHAQLASETVAPLPADLCRLVPETIRQEVVVADQADLRHLVDYDLRLLEAQVTGCP